MNVNAISLFYFLVNNVFSFYNIAIKIWFLTTLIFWNKLKCLTDWKYDFHSIVLNEKNVMNATHSTLSILVLTYCKIIKLWGIVVIIQNNDIIKYVMLEITNCTF
jgi:hypothetical protein